MTSDEKWDRLWIAACGVSSAYETSRQPGSVAEHQFRQQHLTAACETLKKVVDQICPDAPSSAVSESKR